VKVRIFYATLLGWSILSLPTAASAVASDKLEIITPAPVTIPAGVSTVQFTVALPASVTLPANSDLNWGIYSISFLDNQGNYANTVDNWDNGSILGHAKTDFLSVTPNPFGRRATFTAVAQFAGEYYVTVAATLGPSLFTATVDLQFIPAGNFVSMPTLGDGLQVEIENPNPGDDQQTTIRARIMVDPNSYMDFQTYVVPGNAVSRISDLKLGGVTTLGNGITDAQPVQPGEWQNFTISAPDYFKYGFGVRAFWSLNGIPNQDSTWVGQEFFETLPIAINFKKVSSVNPSDGTNGKMLLNFPGQMIYGRSYTARVTMAKKVNGSCVFYLHDSSNSLLGKSSMRNGQAVLTFLAHWNSPGNLKASLEVRCTTGKIQTIGSKVIIGTRQ
jgi:hypothetical protein